MSTAELTAIQELESLLIDDMDVGPWDIPVLPTFPENAYIPREQRTFDPAHWTTDIDITEERTGIFEEESSNLISLTGSRSMPNQPLNRLAMLEDAQTELLAQMNALAEAYAELDRTRDTLLNALANTTQTAERWNIDENNGCDDGEDDCDDDDNGRPAGILQLHDYIEFHSNGLRLLNFGLEDELEGLFLDANGNPCHGIEECISQGVALAGCTLVPGLDKNGNEVEEESSETPFIIR